MRALIHVAVSVVLTNSTLKDSIKSVLITELQTASAKGSFHSLLNATCIIQLNIKFIFF